MCVGVGVCKCVCMCASVMLGYLRTPDIIDNQISKRRK